MLTSQSFSTDGAPERSRPGLFQREMAQLFSVGLSVAPTGERPLRTQVMAYRGPRLQFASLRFSPHTTSAARLSEGPPRLLVTLQKEGTAFVEQDGREAKIEAGDIFVIDPSRPFNIQTGQITTHSVYLQPSSVREILPHIDSLTATVIKGYGGAGAIFRAMMDELFGLGVNLPVDTADAVADALPYVLATALTSLSTSRDLSVSRLRMMHKQRIRQYARENLGDPKLDAATIAAGVNLSCRYVYQLFADEEQTLMKWVWSERLDRCARELAMPEFAGKSISQIAFAWGFNDVAHFSRSFRERFGQAARTYRQMKATPVIAA